MNTPFTRLAFRQWYSWKEQPWGVSADTGEILGIAVKADKTVTFAYRKLGLIVAPGSNYAGGVKVIDIGITDASFEGMLPSIHME